MRLIWKLVAKSLADNKKRTFLTFIGVFMPVALISFVTGIGAQLIKEARAEETGGIASMCMTVIILTAIMCGFIIYTAFCINFDSRTKIMGLLTSVGMSGAQKSHMVLAEALIYALAAVPTGVLAGTASARVFFEYALNVINPTEKEYLYVTDAGWIIFAAALGFIAVLAASFVPMLRLKRISVMDAAAGRRKINISLRQGFFARIVEKKCGRLGKLAGQCYDNHKSVYRGISLSLSGGTTFFIGAYCPLMYARMDDLELGREDMAPLIVIMIFAALVTLAFLISSAGGAVLNIERRKKEFAVLKSLGMDNADIRKMMYIETVFLVFYAAFYGLAGSLILDAAFYSVLLFHGQLLFFSYPVWLFAVFIIFDIVVGLIFALYSALKAAKVNIIESIKS